MNRDVKARSDTPVVLYAAVWEKSDTGCVVYTEAPKIGVRCVRRSMPRGVTAVWKKVESAQAAYNNVPRGVFTWASIGWVESLWKEGRLSLPADVTPMIRSGVFGVGTMRYRVTVTWTDGRKLSSSALENAVGGPSERDDIRKVTLRKNDGYLGYMTELAGLPYIFGSAAMGRERHQAERQIGVDCADLMIYGLRRMGRTIRYRSSRTLSPVSRRVSRVDGQAEGIYTFRGQPIQVGRGGVQPGDWFVFDGHVGAFVEDLGTVGVFDDRDLMMHIAWRELAIEPLRDSGYGVPPFAVRRVVPTPAAPWSRPDIPAIRKESPSGTTTNTLAGSDAS